MKLRSFFKSICAAILCFYLVICGYLYINQREMIYEPDKYYALPASTGLPEFKEVIFRTEDGLTNTSWYAPAQEGKRTVIWFHGNAAGISKRGDYYKALADAGYGVFALEYRGFSKNEGKPTEQGVYADARAAVHYLLKEGINLQDIIFVGRSLGSGVAVQMSSEYTPFATLLLSPYSSVAEVAQERYWYIPVNLLLKDHFNSMEKASTLKAPVLIFHGTADKVIPLHHAQQLHDALATEKQLYIFEGRTHNNLPMQEVIRALGYLEEKA